MIFFYKLESNYLSYIELIPLLIVNYMTKYYFTCYINKYIIINIYLYIAHKILNKNNL